MSMNAFFKAFTQEEIDAMAEDAEQRGDELTGESDSLIDRWVLGDEEADDADEEKYAFSTDIENAWDILDKLLEGAGLNGEGTRVDNALYNGCILISSDEVKKHTQELSQWTEAMVLERLQNLDEDADIYHIEFFKEEDGEEALLENFNNLVEFYTEAAERGLGAVFYLA
ncbi:DUF1877 family protein [Methylomagnum sp.]